MIDPVYAAAQATKADLFDEYSEARRLDHKLDEFLNRCRASAIKKEGS